MFSDYVEYIYYRNANMNVRALVPVAHEQKLYHIDFDF